MANATETLVHAEAEKPGDASKLKRRPSWAGPFEGWSDTAPGLEQALEAAVKKIGTPESDARTP